MPAGRLLALAPLALAAAAADADPPPAAPETAELARMRAAPDVAPPPRPASDLVLVRKGTLPLILSAPHGGRRPVPGVPERLGVGVRQFATVRDTNTAELAERTAAELEKTLGGTVWLVVARFDRRFIDANRPPAGAYESAAARHHYDAYHAAVAAACKGVRAGHRAGLLLDLHGQAAFPAAVCRGTQNGRTVRLLRQRHGWDAVTGPDSVLGRLERAGYGVIPTADAGPDAIEDPRYNGGHIVGTYGSHAGDGIDAVQLEFGGDLRAAAAVPKTARDLAAAVAAFHAAYLK